MQPISLGAAASATAGLTTAAGRTAQAVTRPFAEVLQALAEALKPDSPNPDAIVSTESASDPLESLAQRIKEVLAEAGISVDGPLALQLSIGGNYLQVANDHPQRVQIEAALAHDPRLTDDLRALLESQKAVETQIGPQTMGLGLPQTFGLGVQADAVFAVVAGQPQLAMGSQIAGLH